MKSQNAITYHGKLLEKIGWNAEGDFVNDLLQGLGNICEIDNEKGDKILTNFINAMNYAELEDGTTVTEYQ